MGLSPRKIKTYNPPTILQNAGGFDFALAERADIRSKDALTGRRLDKIKLFRDIAEHGQKREGASLQLLSGVKHIKETVNY